MVAKKEQETSVEEDAQKETGPVVTEDVSGSAGGQTFGFKAGGFVGDAPAKVVSLLKNCGLIKEG
jgi:hypothetical protein